MHAMNDLHACRGVGLIVILLSVWACYRIAEEEEAIDRRQRLQQPREAGHQRRHRRVKPEIGVPRDVLETFPVREYQPSENINHEKNAEER